MQSQRVPYQKIVFVCINRREAGRACCAVRGSEALAEALKARVNALGLGGAIRVSKSGCQDVCARGVNVMVFPDYVWYEAVTEADVERIIGDLTASTAAAPPPGSRSRTRPLSAP